MIKKFIYKVKLWIRERKLYQQFEKSFCKTYNSDYEITELSDCLYRHSYLNDVNQNIVDSCQRKDTAALQKWVNNICGDVLFYDEYYSNRMSMRIIARHIKRHVDKNSTILDVACGHGFIDQKLSKSGFKRITGIDMNAKRVDFLRPYISKCLCTDIDSMDESHNYGVILALEILEHVIDVEATLKKIYSLLTKDGLLYLSVPNDHMIEHESHVRIFTIESLIALLQQMKFRIVAITILPYLNHEQCNDIVCVCRK